MAWVSNLIYIMSFSEYWEKVNSQAIKL